MAWLRIVHETRYRYLTPVVFGPHRLVLRPREGHDLRVEDLRLEISPAFELEWSRDVFGNSIATAHLLEPAEELRIRSEVVLRQTLPLTNRGPRPMQPIPYPLIFPALELPVAAVYQASTFPEDVAEVKKWLGEQLGGEPEGDAHQLIQRIGRLVHRGIRYQRREDKGVQTPQQTIAQGTGSCRDLSTLLLEALRGLGFPARFASGYLDCTASEAGRAATHAWAEAYLPRMGWLGYDPTLGEFTSGKHVVTGVSHHPRGVMPITGTFAGTPEQYRDMQVTVQTQRLEEWPPLSEASGS